MGTYIKMTLPYPDAQVASILTPPQGPCKYAIIKVNMLISDAIIYADFGGEIAGVLALPILFTALRAA